MVRRVATFPEPLKLRLEGLGQARVVAAGDRLLFQGERAEHIGLVMSGQAKAVAYSEDGVETWLGRFEPGEFFGHIAFLSEMDVRFEVSAETDMTLRLIPVSQINALIESAPEINAVFARDLARRLDQMMTRLVEALTLSAKGRVCAELLRLSNPMGISPDKSVIRPNPIFVDMALRINSTRETVSRTVSALQKQGIISREAGAILIQKPEALKKAIQ